MEFKTTEIDIIRNRTVSSDGLQMFCDEIMHQDASKVGERICQEVSAVVKAQQTQTISWSRVFVDLASPAFIDKLVFHETGQVISFDRREILFGELHLVRRVSREDFESKYSHLSFWKDWESKKRAGDEYWEHEKSYGPPEWGIGVGVALVRNGQIVEHHELDCRF